MLLEGNFSIVILKIYVKKVDEMHDFTRYKLDLSLFLQKRLAT